MLSRTRSREKATYPELVQEKWRAHSRILEGPIYMWGCKDLYQDKVTILVPDKISGRHVTKLTKVTAQMAA